ncbi:MAG: membrane-bound lytic murein transglycosylase MltF [Sulfurimonas sp.]|nr:membrane-bound lytic murein transglycosylase MltF [Sulfurimonadaceae bacterium]
MSFSKNNSLVVILFFSIYSFMFGWFSHTEFNELKRYINPNDLQVLKKEGTLNVVLINSSSTYYIDGDGKKGFEYDLLKSYADYLGVSLNITVANTTKEAIELSRVEDIHITSALLAKDELSELEYNFGPSYMEVQQQVICNRKLHQNRAFPENLEMLSELNVAIANDSRYSNTINGLKDSGVEIKAELVDDISSEEILSRVALGEFDCTIVDNNTFSINQRYYPELSFAFSVGAREQLAWIISPKAKALKENLYSWITTFFQSGEMARLKDHYFSNNIMFDYFDTTSFYKKVTTVLPKYKNFFLEASQKYDIPYHLLAAISYQESHWNPNATSPTGVKGLMMLTLSTASGLGITNRTDPKESIFGGARYISQIASSLDENIVGEDRFKLALVAYNIGLGHLNDAQTLAVKMGLNPYIWQQLKSVLPLLAQKRYYKNLKHGYARGSEAIKYVEAIYNYKDMLQNASSIQSVGVF